MNIVLIAGDFMESEDCRKIGATFQERGHQVELFLAAGQEPTFTPEEVETTVGKADFVLLAVDNDFDQTLRASKYAAYQCGIPFGIYAGSNPNCYRGENIKRLRDKAALVFVFRDSEIAPAQDLFPAATVVASGSPHWEEFFFPVASKQEVRKTLWVGKNEVIILVSGDKDLTLNILLFALTIEAASKLENHLPVRIVIGLHPGDRNPVTAYRDLGRFVPPHVKVTFLCHQSPRPIPEETDLRLWPTPQFLPGADLLVNFVSTLGYEAACQRIPVICFLPMYGEKWLESSTGSSDWEQCLNGSAVEVRGSSSETLTLAMKALLTDKSSRLALRQIQTLAYPKPPVKGLATNTIVTTLENYFQA